MSNEAPVSVWESKRWIVLGNGGPTADGYMVINGGLTVAKYDHYKFSPLAFFYFCSYVK